MHDMYTSESAVFILKIHFHSVKNRIKKLKILMYLGGYVKIQVPNLFQIKRAFTFVQQNFLFLHAKLAT